MTRSMLALLALSIALALAGCGGARYKLAPPVQKAARTPIGTFAANTPEAPYEAPPPTDASAPHAPQIGEFRLSNGLRVLYMNDPSLPLVALRAVVDRGADQAAPGVADQTALSLAAGTTHRTDEAISYLIGAWGASYAARASHGSVTVDVEIPAPRLAEALRLVADLLANPTFPEPALDKERHASLAAIDVTRKEPAAVARRALAKALYPSGHPYATPAEGSPGDARAVTRDQIVAFHREHFAPSRTTLVLAGRIEPERLEERVKTHYGDWSAIPVPARAVAPVAQVASRRVLLIDRPGSVQSTIAIGCVGAAWSDPDEVPVRVLAYVVQARLQRELRRWGHAYSVRAAFDFRRGAGPFRVETAVAIESTASALEIALKELDGMREGRIEQPALDRVQRTAMSYLWEGFDTRSDAVQTLSVPALRSESVASFLERSAAFGKVALEDVRAAAKDRLPTSLMQIVVVGDARRVRSMLEKAGLGKVEMVD